MCEWLGHQPGVVVFQESRILVSIHRFLEETYRFQNPNHDTAVLTKLASQLVSNYYAASNILIGKKLLVDKEPLEPIAFPPKDYRNFIINFRLVFPDAKLLFVIRDPVATIWSMSRRRWGESLTNREAKKFTLQEFTENWCSCADLLLSYRTDPSTYILQYGCLVSDPVNESRRIYDFLQIKYGDSFQPRKTKEIGFNRDEREEILLSVEPQLKQLSAQGILNIS